MAASYTPEAEFWIGPVKNQAVTTVLPKCKADMTPNSQWSATAG
jgi:hypothetical protein